jgi:DNA-binding IclR family transcriptional regulator
MARAAPAASRAVSILSFLTAHPARGFTISELVQHLGMNIASAHATLAVLSDAGFVVRDPVHRTYVLGPALTATGYAALDQHPAVAASIAQADVLARELDAEVGVSALAGRDIVLVARRGPSPASPGAGYPGDRTPLLAPFGAVFMAWATEDAITTWLERGAVSSAAAEQYRRALAGIRERGFSVPLEPIAGPAVTKAMARVRSEPVDDGAEHELAAALQGGDEMLLGADPAPGPDHVVFKTVTAPVFDAIGRVLLSISVTGPGRPVPRHEVVGLGTRLVDAATIATREGRGRMPGDEALVRGHAP